MSINTLLYNGRTRPSLILTIASFINLVAPRLLILQLHNWLTPTANSLYMRMHLPSLQRLFVNYPTRPPLCQITNNKKPSRNWLFSNPFRDGYRCNYKLLAVNNLIVRSGCELINCKIYYCKCDESNQSYFHHQCYIKHSLKFKKLCYER